MKNKRKAHQADFLDPTSWSDKIFGIRDVNDLEEAALLVFQYQYENNAVYKKFSEYLSIDPNRVNSIENIPFLPVEFFKTHRVVTGSFDPQLIFRSSGTTGANQAIHEIRNANLYEAVFMEGFRREYGPPEDYCILTLLPSYLEREDASLVKMAEGLIRQTGHPDSGFYLNEMDLLVEKLQKLESQKQPTLLIGVSFALLDLIEHQNLNLHHTLVMETGGMKGKRKEMIRAELHDELKKGFQLENIHSEYGMTELLSQAYSKMNGYFQVPPWMKLQVREINDPFEVLPSGKSGRLNIIDLANIHSCSFLATQDLGRIHETGSFEVLGRTDNSDIRGCNLMV